MNIFGLLKLCVFGTEMASSYKYSKKKHTVFTVLRASESNEYCINLTQPYISEANLQ